jgi:hypothetical protein
MFIILRLRLAQAFRPEEEDVSTRPAIDDC